MKKNTVTFWYLVWEKAEPHFYRDLEEVAEDWAEGVEVVVLRCTEHKRAALKVDSKITLEE